ncbi:hypothetical protein, partial [Salmonella enterica]|uniref:hypothetical protein n=1 Tax=Salmonella enterica TaxID=28901 RepID=UPI003524C617
YYSAAEGDGFERLDEHALDSLVITSGDPERVYASGVAASAPGHPEVYFGSWQRGTSFESYRFALDIGEYGVSLLALQPGPRERLFAVAHAYLGTSQLDRLVVSDDGAQT